MESNESPKKTNDNALKRTTRFLLAPVGVRFSRKGKKSAPHGVALLMVLISLALMSTVVVDLGDNEMIRYRLAANDRDSMKAQALAESSINVARLLLTMQSAVQPCITQFASMGIPLPAHTFWEIIPLDSELLKGLTSGELQASLGLDVSQSIEARKATLEEVRAEKGAAFDPEKEGAGKEAFVPPEGGFGAFDGSFQAEIEDEERKAATLRGWTQATSPAQCFSFAQRVYYVLQPERYDFLFEDRDEQGNHTSREELTANLFDWIDDNQDTTDPKADPATWCKGVGGSEDAIYSSGYKTEPKNAFFDSPGELRLVRGITDAHFTAFADKISLYADGRINILSAPPTSVESLIIACAQPGDPFVSNPQWMRETLSLWAEWKALGPLLGGGPATPDGFLSFLDTRGLVVADATKCKDMMTTESKHFTVRATAAVGDVTRTITTVMRIYGATEELYYYSVR